MCIQAGPQGPRAALMTPRDCELNIVRTVLWTARLPSVCFVKSRACALSFIHTAATNVSVSHALASASNGGAVTARMTSEVGGAASAISSEKRVTRTEMPGCTCNIVCSR